MHSNLSWYKPAEQVVTGTDTFRINSQRPQGLKGGVNASLPVEVGHVLKAGTLLTRSGGVLVPHNGFTEKQELVFDADITGTATKKVVFTIAGLTITTTSNILYLEELFLLFKDAKPGDTGAALLTAYNAASSSDIFDSVSGTLGDWYVLRDLANKTLLFVSSSYQTNVSNLTFTLVDTAASPVDLSSHVTSTNIPLSTATIDGILVHPTNTVSAQKSVSVWMEAEMYSNILSLHVEPESETETIGGAYPDLLSTGIFNFAQLQTVLLQTEFQVWQALSPLVS